SLNAVQSGESRYRAAGGEYGDSERKAHSWDSSRPDAGRQSESAVGRLRIVPVAAALVRAPSIQRVLCRIVASARGGNTRRARRSTAGTRVRDCMKLGNRSLFGPTKLSG